MSTISSSQYKALALFAGAMLVLGIPSGWPYAYYQILRWVVAIAAGVGAYKAYEQKKTAWMWVMIGVAVLFNPIAPVYLEKSTWVVMDVVAASIFGCAVFKSKQSLV